MNSKQFANIQAPLYVFFFREDLQIFFYIIKPFSINMQLYHACLHTRVLHFSVKL